MQIRTSLEISASWSLRNCQLVPDLLQMNWFSLTFHGDLQQCLYDTWLWLESCLKKCWWLTIWTGDLPCEEHGCRMPKNALLLAGLPWPLPPLINLIQTAHRTAATLLKSWFILNSSPQTAQKHRNLFLQQYCLYSNFICVLIYVFMLKSYKIWKKGQQLKSVHIYLCLSTEVKVCVLMNYSFYANV